MARDWPPGRTEPRMSPPHSGVAVLEAKNWIIAWLEWLAISTRRAWAAAEATTQAARAAPRMRPLRNSVLFITSFILGGRRGSPARNIGAPNSSDRASFDLHHSRPAMN